MEQDHTGIQHKAANRNREQIRETQHPAAAARPDFKDGAYPHERRRGANDPDLVLMNKIMKGIDFFEGKREGCTRAHDRDKSHHEQRDTATKRMQSHQHRMGHVRVAASIRGVTL